MIPQVIGRYEIREKLGQGGMASVYLAYDPNFAREVAIKLLPPQFLHDPTFLQRFRQEAQTIAALEHFAVVPVYDFGEHDGQPFLVMSLMRGGSLVERIGQGALSLAEAARILAALAPTLDEVHQRGIIHRDLKPANILFDERNKPHIADFGIVKLKMGTQSFTTGGIIGTPQYMSPEQWEGLDLDGRSDIYALGVILFQMLAGECPYSGNTAGSIMKKHLMNPVPNILSHRPDLPPAIQPIIEQALCKERDKRYPTANALSQALEQLLLGTQAPPTERLPEPPTLLYQPEQPTSPPAHQPTKPPTHAYVKRAKSGKPTIQQTHQPTTSKWLLGGLGILVVAFLSLLIMIAVGLSGENNTPADDTITPPIAQEPITATVTPTTPPTITPELVAGSRITSEKDGMTLLYVPEGEFEMGAAEEGYPAYDAPSHTVFLSTFWIDETEITNAMFTRFVEETGYETDAEKEGSVYVIVEGWDETSGIDWQHPEGPESNLSGLENHPVVYISWNDATAYCEWAGRRLPTEAEWEKAARGTDGRRYPWGNQAATAERAHFWGNIAMGERTTEVGSYPAGASPYGALDMAGNVSEWVNDFYDESYYFTSPKENPLGPSTGSARVLRGGSWSDSVTQFYSPTRGKYLSSIRIKDLGFRCATSEP